MLYIYIYILYISFFWVFWTTHDSFPFQSFDQNKPQGSGLQVDHEDRRFHQQIETHTVCRMGASHPFREQRISQFVLTSAKSYRSVEVCPHQNPQSNPSNMAGVYHGFSSSAEWCIIWCRGACSGNAGPHHFFGPTANPPIWAPSKDGWVEPMIMMSVHRILRMKLSFKCQAVIICIYYTYDCCFSFWLVSFELYIESSHSYIYNNTYIGWIHG